MMRTLLKTFLLIGAASLALATGPARADEGNFGYSD